MSLGALGIVYGDIGTSPLYAMRECFAGTHPIAPPPANVLGVLSLIFWALIVVQKRGTGRVGAVFGPVTFLWFVTISVLGVAQVVREPGVFAAVSPVHAMDFFRKNGFQGFLTLGTVFLVVTGGEALYADLGH